MKELKVISNRTDFSDLQTAISKTDSVIVPIFSDTKAHYMKTSISVLFVFIENVVYCLSVTHPDALQIPEEWLLELSPLFAVVPNKKELLKFIPNGNLVDYKGLQYVKTGNITDKSCDIKNFIPVQSKSLYYINKHISNVNNAIAIMKLLEIAEIWHDEIIDKISKENVWEFLNNVIIPTCYFMESGGICVDKNLFFAAFGQRFDDIIYTGYNPYIITGRCSNSNNGINFSSLKKDSIQRAGVVSRFGKNGKLVMMDFESYHLRIVADLINYPQPTERFHGYLAKKYFNTETITPEQYIESKKKTFSILYNLESGEYENVDFFKMVNKWADELWQIVKKEGYFYTKHGRRVDINWIDNVKKSKLLNYLIQSIESEQTLATIYYDLIPLFKNKNSKFVLYTYDSILIDYCMDDGIGFLEDVMWTLEHTASGYYPIKVSYGDNYRDLQEMENNGLRHNWAGVCGISGS